jgi:hypothetical protein
MPVLEEQPGRVRELPEKIREFEPLKDGLTAFAGLIAAPALLTLELVKEGAREAQGLINYLAKRNEETDGR